MPVVVQYQFNTEKQYLSAGAPKLVDTALSIVELGLKDGKYHVEVLFKDDQVPENGLLSAKAVAPIPHKFIGFPTLAEYELKNNPPQ